MVHMTGIETPPQPTFLYLTFNEFFLVNFEAWSVDLTQEPGKI